MQVYWPGIYSCRYLLCLWFTISKPRVERDDARRAVLSEVVHVSLVTAFGSYLKRINHSLPRGQEAVRLQTRWSSPCIKFRLHVYLLWTQPYTYKSFYPNPSHRSISYASILTWYTLHRSHHACVRLPPVRIKWLPLQGTCYFVRRRAYNIQSISPSKQTSDATNRYSNLLHIHIDINIEVRERFKIYISKVKDIANTIEKGLIITIKNDAGFRSETRLEIWVILDTVFTSQQFCWFVSIYFK